MPGQCALISNPGTDQLTVKHCGRVSVYYSRYDILKLELTNSVEVNLVKRVPIFIPMLIPPLQ